MEFKRIICILFLFCVLFSASAQRTYSYAQQEVVSKLIDFYQSADMDYYIEEANNNIEKSLHNASRQFISIDSSDYNIIIHKESIPKTIIPFLCVEFKDMAMFDERSSIYNHIIIDSAIVFVFIQVDNKRIKRIINTPDYGVFSYEGQGTIKQFFSSLLSSDFYHFNNYYLQNRALRLVKKKKPDCLLFCPRLGGDGYNLICILKDLLFVKNGHIYILRSSESKVYELDEYAHRCLKDNLNDSNRNLEGWSRVEVPLWFEGNSVKNYKAGKTPDEFNIIHSRSDSCLLPPL